MAEPLELPVPEISREGLLAVKERVKQQLIRDFHSHRLTARLYRRAGNVARAKVDEATMAELRQMIQDLSDEPEPVRGTSIRLTEDDS